MYMCSNFMSPSFESSLSIWDVMLSIPGALRGLSFLISCCRFWESERREAGGRVHRFGQFSFNRLIQLLVMWSKHILEIVGEKVRLVLVVCRPRSRRCGTETYRGVRGLSFAFVSHRFPKSVVGSVKVSDIFGKGCITEIG